MGPTCHPLSSRTHVCRQCWRLRPASRPYATAAPTPAGRCCHDIPRPRPTFSLHPFPQLPRDVPFRRKLSPNPIPSSSIAATASTSPSGRLTPLPDWIEDQNECRHLLYLPVLEVSEPPSAPRRLIRSSRKNSPSTTTGCVARFAVFGEPRIDPLLLSYVRTSLQQLTDHLLAPRWPKLDFHFSPTAVRRLAPPPRRRPVCSTPFTTITPMTSGEARHLNNQVHILLESPCSSVVVHIFDGRLCT